MLEDALGLIAGSWPAEALKTSRIVYPLVNAVHILSFATLFGAIAVLDLAILARARRAFVLPLTRFVPPIAGAGLCAALLSGFVLFSVQPFDYAANPAFRLKLVLVAAGLCHVAVLRLTPSFRRMRETGIATAGLVASAGLSLGIWTAAIVAGRFIAFLA
ncbi:DUF2214 domain-containing protein [Jiella mangrovi]|uniref:DUF2214 domain-containing protein n=1 Tax=Jiella mangrovi TaxID=2821407 RepID=A0ABS4BBN7_9HYPH|nr:DUF2214 domain-containing protein [Jiella mangrovi]MBP0614146.1 DUF2214 domain-containing protein [Jiella mangrovi]